MDLRVLLLELVGIAYVVWIIRQQRLGLKAHIARRLAALEFRRQEILSKGRTQP